MATVSNRRNFYRLLQVQPDAAPEVIKAAYRALMALHHPDKGGDHATAALITNAYATLSEPRLRAAYDAMRAARSGRATSHKAPDASGRSGAAPGPADHPGPRAEGSECCPMCALALPLRAPKLARCPRCQAPLTQVQSGGEPLSKERRRMMRVSKSDWALLYQSWNVDGIDVRMRDLSLDGISVYSGATLPPHQRVRIVGATFDVVGEIVSTRKIGEVYTLHAHLVTAIFATRTGGFVSTSA